MPPTRSPIVVYQLLIDTKELLVKTANKTVTEVAALFGEKHAGKGGYFRAFVLPGKPSAPYTELVELSEFWAGGEANHSNSHKYWIVSIEKAIRVVNAPRLGRYSSYTYRHDESEHRYGGAILFEATIPEFGEDPVWIVFTFSGLPELADETVTALIAMRMPWRVKVNHLKLILDGSSNEIGLELLEKEFLNKE